MVLPFVREVFADVEKSAALARAASHLKSGAGGMSVSGLTPTAKSLFISLLHRAAARPLIVVVPHNRDAEAMLPVVQAFAELTGVAGSDGHGGAAEIAVHLPAPDVLPFEGLSPHPEIQEARATALWKIASGAVCVRPSSEPANISVAPNSPSALPHASAAPDASPARAPGMPTRANVRASPAPSVREASRSCCCTGAGCAGRS